MRRLTPSTILVTVMLALAACGGGSSQPTATLGSDGAVGTTPASTSTPLQASVSTVPPTATALRSTPSPTASRAISTAAGISAATATPNPSPTPTATPEPCPGAIAWDAAASHVGQVVTVRGPVLDATFASESRGQPTFLNIGRGYPDPARFTVVIWIPNRANFPAPPEELYSGQTVCVTGQVTLYNGSAEMEIIGPEDIVAS